MKRITSIGLMAMGSALYFGGMAESARNSAQSMESISPSVRTYIDLERTLEGNVPVSKVIEDPNKYVVLDRLYDEMTEDSRFMEEVNATRDSIQSSVRKANYWTASLVGFVPIMVGFSGFLNDRDRRKKRKEDEQNA